MVAAPYVANIQDTQYENMKEASLSFVPEEEIDLFTVYMIFPRYISFHFPNYIVKC